MISDNYKIVKRSTLVNMADHARRLTNSKQKIRIKDLTDKTFTYPDIEKYCDGTIDTFNYNLKEIPTEFFSDYTTLQSVNLEECSYIGYRAFYNCASLTYLSAPECINIANNAFDNCTLSEVSFPMMYSLSGNALTSPSLERITLNTCNKVPANAFLGCKNLQTVSIPMCTSIGSSAFLNCSGLTSMNLMNCYDINEYAFANCVNLSEIYLGNANMDIASTAFVNTPIANGTGTIYVPENQYGRFTEWSKWTSYSTIIKSFKFSETTYTYNDQYGIMNGPSEFYDDKIIMVGRQTFFNCRQLEKISLPNCEYADYLTDSPVFYSAELPKCKITNQTFYNTNISMASLPECMILGPATFNRCTNLTSINLPKCKIIEEAAFSYCTKLSAVYLPSTEMCHIKEWSGGIQTVFGQTPIVDSSYLGYFGSIYVPSNLVDTYKTDSEWSRYADRITSIIE